MSNIIIRIYKEKKMNKIVGKVSEVEKEEILDLYEKKLALENLLKIFDSKEEENFQALFDKYVQINKTFEMWWSEKGQKYNWSGSENGYWSIDFDTCQIILQNQ